MAQDIFQRIEKIAGPTMKGLVAVTAPNIAKGLISEYIGKIDMSQLIEYIQSNTSLWSKISPNDQIKARNMVKGVLNGKVDWLTSDWLIDAIKKDRPQIASLFLSWDKAQNWLNEQINEIKKEVK